MKEVSNLPQSLCGLTQYFGDIYSVGHCIYKKCIDECVEGQYEFTFAGQTYTRKRYCCNNEDLCNGTITHSFISLCLSLIYPMFLIAVVDAVSNAKLSWWLLIGLFFPIIYMLL